MIEAKSETENVAQKMKNVKRFDLCVNVFMFSRDFVPD